MNIEFTITKAYVFPQRGEYVNVIGKVDWDVSLIDGSVESLGRGETLLNVDSIASFIPAEQVTTQQIIDWVIAQEGGETFLDTLRSIHAPFIEQKKRTVGLVPWTI